MAKFTIVKAVPKELDKGTFVVQYPDFAAEIEANVRKSPKNGQTAVHHLREILGSIAEKYDHDMNIMRVNLTNYIGLPFANTQELSAIVVRILEDQYPTIFGKYLDSALKARPMNTKLVYYVGNLTSATPFYSAGLDLLDEKEVESYLSGKPKKVVGKPAITNEEAKKNEIE